VENLYSTLTEELAAIMKLYFVERHCYHLSVSRNKVLGANKISSLGLVGMFKLRCGRTVTRAAHARNVYSIFGRKTLKGCKIGVKIMFKKVVTVKHVWRK
jgi:hypothetical protein